METKEWISKHAFRLIKLKNLFLTDIGKYESVKQDRVKAPAAGSVLAINISLRALMVAVEKLRRTLLKYRRDLVETRLKEF